MRGADRAAVTEPAAGPLEPVYDAVAAAARITDYLPQIEAVALLVIMNRQPHLSGVSLVRPTRSGPHPLASRRSCSTPRIGRLVARQPVMVAKDVRDHVRAPPGPDSASTNGPLVGSGRTQRAVGTYRQARARERSRRCAACRKRHCSPPPATSSPAPPTLNSPALAPGRGARQDAPCSG